jgi:hypothetical protein
MGEKSWSGVQTKALVMGLLYIILPDTIPKTRCWPAAGLGGFGVARIIESTGNLK